MKRTVNVVGCISIAFILSTRTIAVAAESEVTFTTVALTGEVAPGAGNATFVGFDSQSLDEHGRAVFRGGLAGDDIFPSFNGQGVWSQGNVAENPVTLNLVALAGTTPPGITDGAIFNRFGELRINAAGQVGFNGLLIGSGVNGANDGGVWSQGQDAPGPAPLTLIAREGDRAPGTTENTVFALINSGFILNHSGQAAFRAILSGDGFANDLSIWSQGRAEPGPGNLQLVARRADPAPGTATGVTFTGFQLPVFNDTGQVAFRGGVAGNGVDVFNNSGLWSQGRSEAGPGELQLVVRRGDASPGTSEDATFVFFSDPRISNSGQVTFVGAIQGDEILPQNDSGIWLQSQAGSQPDELYLVAREGDAAPGVLDGAKFGSSLGPQINATGEVAFFSDLVGNNVTSVNNSGIWMQQHTNEGFEELHLITREGDAAPGTSAGTAFSDLLAFLLNDNGQIAFTSNLAGNDVNASNDRGLWATDASGTLQLIVREGDQINVSDDPLLEALRTVESLSALDTRSGGDSKPLGFNNAGQIAVTLTFTDGSSGVFVASIPEPASLTILAATMAVTRRRRSCRTR